MVTLGAKLVWLAALLAQASGPPALAEDKARAKAILLANPGGSNVPNIPLGNHGAFQ
jgi:hypothetical protein